MNELLQQGDQLAALLRGRSGAARLAAVELLEQARRTGDGAGLLMPTSHDLYLVRPEGPWNCLSLSLRPNGGCLVSLDGETYLVDPNGQVLDEDEHDQRLDQAMQRFENSTQSPTPSLGPTPARGLPWEQISQALLGVGGGWLTAQAAAPPESSESSGGIHLEPLERPYLRADGQDSLQVVAHLDGPGAGQLSLRAEGPNAAWLGLSPPGEGEFYRYWTVQAARPDHPEAMLESRTVELSLHSGQLCRRFQLEVLPPLQLHAEPVILLQGAGPARAQARVLGGLPGQCWELVEATAQGPLTVRAEPAAEAGAFALSLDAREEGETGPLGACRLAIRDAHSQQRLETTLPVWLLAPGPQVLSAFPLRLRADGACEQDLSLTVWRWNALRQGVEVDEEALSKVEFRLEPERAFEAADLSFRFHELRGTGWQRQAVYRVSGRVPVPGLGVRATHMRLTVGQTESPERVPLLLELDPISQDQGLSGEQERELLQDVMERYFRRPDSQADVFYELLSTALERSRPPLPAAELRRLRRWILKEAVLAWQANGRGYMQSVSFCHRLLEIARQAGWQPFREGASDE